ncbi:MAG TPA: hypothetical protein VKP30_10875, partial [Polyangiaceae bacterium]|nr:hypothetical protein [Polyangiaceae bacterium]
SPPLAEANTEPAANPVAATVNAESSAPRDGAKPAEQGTESDVAREPTPSAPASHAVRTATPRTLTGWRPARRKDKSPTTEGTNAPAQPHTATGATAAPAPATHAAPPSSPGVDSQWGI